MIILVAGKKQAGKDTTAEYLTTRHNFKRIGFADPVKRAVAEVFGWTFESMFDPNLKEVVDPEWGISRRQALQDLGTEWGQYSLSKFPEFEKTTGRALWARKIAKEIALEGTQRDWVIPDFRFPHEYNELVHHFGRYHTIIRWRVLRPPLEQTDMHESERYALKMPVDFDLLNNDTKEQFSDTIKRIYSICQDKELRAYGNGKKDFSPIPLNTFKAPSTEI